MPQCRSSRSVRRRSPSPLRSLLWCADHSGDGAGRGAAAHTPDLDNGRTMFDIGGCASCHATPNENPDKVERTRLGGGLALKSPFGTFYVPNISPDPNDGIGAWSEADFVTALWKGTSPRGRHLFPAFPYTSYQHMQLADVRDLFAYLKTLPPVAGPCAQARSGVSFQHPPAASGSGSFCFFHGGPFSPIRAIGAMESRRLSGEWAGPLRRMPQPAQCPRRHHRERAFRRRPDADGKGWVPNITPTGLQHWGEDDTAWKAKDIASYLRDGMNPAGDFAGGAMAEVIRNTSLLSAADRAAIAGLHCFAAAAAGSEGAEEREITRVTIRRRP